MTFEQNTEMDARCVYAAMLGGITAMLAVALRSGCPDPDTAMRRAEWLKTQSAEYINSVVMRAEELESSNAVMRGGEAIPLD